MKTNKEISKFLSLVLRHQPQKIGLILDENGWANVEELLQKMNQYHYQINITKLEEVVSTNDKQRFTFDDSKQKIRANQGHSIEIDLDLIATEPPEILYHGTADKYINSIRNEGISKQSRQHVHLSENIETAKKVGQRHGKAIVLEIKAKEMHQKGFIFYISKNNVWLTDKVDKEFII
ncbi:MAG: RNA 2'-phosphotransferase [Bacteroidetes bacterium]|nr:MAG: RNA 2'-phosphotransferase [Bacteroidota bacterium]TAG86597.1 MAG: RNA 2'-phosphotransferase [Bacteroidota bacterium]